MLMVLSGLSLLSMLLRALLCPSNGYPENSRHVSGQNNGTSVAKSSNSDLNFQNIIKVLSTHTSNHTISTLLITLTISYLVLLLFFGKVNSNSWFL